MRQDRTETKGRSLGLGLIFVFFLSLFVVAPQQDALACGKECQKAVPTATSVAAARARMQQLGIEAAVSQISSSPEQAMRLLAIAIHETGGEENPLTAINKIGATCAFQVMPLGHIDAADVLGMPRPPRRADGSVDEFTKEFLAVRQRITTDPVACAKAGKKILGYMLARTGNNFNEAVCGYGAQCVENGGCCGSMEVAAIKGFLEGKPVDFKFVDKTTPEGAANTNAKHGDIELRVDGQLVGTLRNCRNMSGDLGLELAKAAKAYQAAVATASHMLWDQSMVSISKAAKSFNPGERMQDVQGSIIGNHCLDYLKDPNGFFRMLSRLFSGSFWEALLEAVIDGLMNYITNRVCQFVADLLNSAMNSLCIPLPGFSFSLDLNLPNISSGTCSGLSMADVVQFSSNYQSTNGASSQGLSELNFSAGSRGFLTNVPVRSFNPQTGRPNF